MATATPTKRSKTKAPAVAVEVPDGIDAAASFIKRLGDVQRRHAMLKAELDDQVAALVESRAGAMLALAQQAQALQQGIQVWAEASRAALTQNGKTKTARLVTGEVAWRQRPPSVTVRNADEVLEQLRSLGLTDYVRTRDEVNKEAILSLDALVAQLDGAGADASDADRQARVNARLLKGIKGLAISKGVEDFVITPFETDPATVP